MWDLDASVKSVAKVVRKVNILNYVPYNTVRWAWDSHLGIMGLSPMVLQLFSGAYQQTKTVYNTQIKIKSKNNVYEGKGSRRGSEKKGC